MEKQELTGSQTQYLNGLKHDLKRLTMSDLVRYTNKINKATQYFLGESKREPSKQEEDKQLQFDVYLTLVEHIVVGDYEKALGLAKKITASSSETNQVLSRRILNDWPIQGQFKFEAQQVDTDQGLRSSISIGNLYD